MLPEAKYSKVTEAPIPDDIEAGYGLTLGCRLWLGFRLRRPAIVVVDDLGIDAVAHHTLQHLPCQPGDGRTQDDACHIHASIIRGHQSFLISR